MSALECLAKQVGSALPQKDDEFEEMIKYPTHEKFNDVLKKGLDKYHLLHSIELSDSSEEELHLNQDMTSELSAACVPKDKVV